MDVQQWISELGIPAGLLAFAGYGATRIARFFAPLATRLTEKHCELIDTLKSQSHRQTEILDAQSRVMEQNGTLLLQIHHAVHENPTEVDGA